MIDRRSIFTATAAIGTFLASAFGSKKTKAGMQQKYPNHTYKNGTPTGDVEPRGAIGRMERLPTLRIEGVHDFTCGMRTFLNKHTRKLVTRADKLISESGRDPRKEIPAIEAMKILDKDTLLGTSGRMWISNQQVTWKILQDHYHENADEYLAEMEAADNDGPGKLELNPEMEIPDYTKHEIHIQPGGYVGDAFAGPIYHYGTLSFYNGVMGDNTQDQIHVSTANRLPLPEDGVVKRILVQGCGLGQMTVALAERFPEAEVWGIDVGGPLVRYGHMRARELGVPVNFAQRLAEDTKFPDNHFDIVTSYIINHELPQDKNRAVIKEAYRVTRPGGYYYPVDFLTGGGKGKPYSNYRRWWDHRWNNEVWSYEYHTFNFDQEIEMAGFKLNPNTPAALPRFGKRHAVKEA